MNVRRLDLLDILRSLDAKGYTADGSEVPIPDLGFRLWALGQHTCHAASFAPARGGSRRGLKPED